MTVKARINSDNELLLKGILTENEEILTLDIDGNLTANKVYKTLESLDENELIDDESLLDEDYLIDDNESMSGFLSWFFGVEIYEEPSDRVSFLEDGSIIANDIKENQTLGDD